MTSLRRVVPYVRQYPWSAGLGFLTVFLMVAAELVIPRMLQLIIDQGIRQGSMATVWHGVWFMLAAATGSAFATLGQGIFRARLSQGLAFDIRNDLFNHIQSLSFAKLDEMQTGGLMTRISSDVDIIRMFSSNGLLLLLRALLMIIGSAIMIVLTDWQLSLVMFACLSVAGVVIWVFMNTASPLFMIVQEKLSALNTAIQENLAGIRVVKAFVRENDEIQRFDDFNADYMQQNIRVGRILALVTPALGILTNLGIVGVIWFGGRDVINQRLTLGELVAFNNYLMIGMMPLLLLGNMLNMASRAEASAARVFEVLDTEPQIQFTSTAYYPDHMRGEIRFENVSFRYRTGENGGKAAERNGNVLEAISFKAKPGQRIALLGTTGSGKSTLVSLLSRFYDVTDGRILIDGVDVRDWHPEALRAQIGLVLQTTTLFSGTIRDNIAYGKPEASLEDVIAAARAAQAHDFIMTMPDGYDSPVEARGANLSGGQKQRIAIARALLVKPGILILDDSTSAVDLETEINIQDALDEISRTTTIFIIAQRINSVLNADQIIILEAGRIAAQGTHAELLRSNPIYQEIYRSQFEIEPS